MDISVRVRKFLMLFVLSKVTNYSYSKEIVEEFFLAYFEIGEEIKELFSNNVYQPSSEKMIKD